MCSVSWAAKPIEVEPNELITDIEADVAALAAIRDAGVVVTTV